MRNFVRHFEVALRIIQFSAKWNVMNGFGFKLNYAESGAKVSLAHAEEISISVLDNVHQLSIICPIRTM